MATRTLLESALETDDRDEVRFQMRTAMQLLDALEHKLDSVEESAVFEEMIEQDEALRERLEELGILGD
ncbi:MAG: hypothetical protein ABEJ67_01830 [Halanaeroarchaeum sp.]